MSSSPLIDNDDPAMFRPWDHAASAASSRNSQDFLGAPPTRQRTIQACDKCRERKTKCSGEHPVCKRCTARGLICQYSGRERVHSTTKARLRHASSLDFHFRAGMYEPGVRQADFGYSMQYPGFHPAASALYQEQQQRYLALPPLAERRFPSSQPCSPVAPPPPRMSLPHIMHPDQFSSPMNSMPPHLQQHYVRRVQSQSALVARGPTTYDHMLTPEEHDSCPPIAHRRVGSLLKLDMRTPNEYQNYPDDGSSGSEPPSATSSVYDTENISYSSESSGSTFPSPLSGSASELDQRLVNQGYMPRYRHHTLPALETSGHPVQQHHSPAASIDSLTDLSSPGGAHSSDIAIRENKGSFENPWASHKHERQQPDGEMELVYPSPATPSGGEEGFYEYLLERAPRRSLSPASVKEKSLREAAPATFQLLSSPLSEGITQI